MKAIRVVGAGVVVLLGLSGATAEGHGCGRWSIGIGIGAPVYRPWCGCGPDFVYYYYRPAPVYVAPAPVYVAPAPVVVQPAPAYQPPAYQAPQPQPIIAQSVSTDTRQTEIDRYLQLLADPDERIRHDSVLQLGRLKAERAIDALAATLAGDRSPAVREAAARSLGLIGSPKALPALQQASSQDGSPDVRKTAQFALEVIQSRN